MQRIFFELLWGPQSQLTSQRLKKRLWDDASEEHKNLFNQYCDLGLLTREPDPLDYIYFLPIGSCKTGFIWTANATWADVAKYAEARDVLNAQSEFGYIRSEILLVNDGQHPTSTCGHPFELAGNIV